MLVNMCATFHIHSHLSLARDLFGSIFIFAQLVLLHLLRQLHNTLAFLSVAILRSFPVNLLAFDGAVAVGLATLAKLASGGVQLHFANTAGLSHFAEV